MYKEPFKIILDSNLVYSLFNKNLLFSIHYFFLLFIKIFNYSLFFKPHYSLVIKYFAHYSLFIKKGNYSLIITPHPTPLICSGSLGSLYSFLFILEIKYWTHIHYGAKRCVQCANFITGNEQTQLH